MLLLLLMKLGMVDPIALPALYILIPCVFFDYQMGSLIVYSLASPQNHYYAQELLD